MRCVPSLAPSSFVLALLTDSSCRGETVVVGLVYDTCGMLCIAGVEVLCGVPKG